MIAKIKQTITRVQELWKLPDTLSEFQKSQASKIQLLFTGLDNTNQRINEHTVVHADVNIKSPSQVILVGRYRNHDYVRIFEVDHKTLSGLIEYLSQTQKGAHIGHFDMPGDWPDLSVVYRRDQF